MPRPQNSLAAVPGRAGQRLARCAVSCAPAGGTRRWPPARSPVRRRRTASCTTAPRTRTPSHKRGGFHGVINEGYRPDRSTGPAGDRDTSTALAIGMATSARGSTRIPDHAPAFLAARRAPATVNRSRLAATGTGESARRLWRRVRGGWLADGGGATEAVCLARQALTCSSLVTTESLTSLSASPVDSPTNCAGANSVSSSPDPA